MIKNLFLLLLTLLVISCKNDDDNSIDEVVISEKVEVYNSDGFEDSYVLAVENGGTKSYLLNKEGFKVHEWNFDTNLGNDLELMNDGKLVGMFKVTDPDISFGGFGGMIRIINTDNSTQWEYNFASENYLAHHDVELLPNGNVLFIAWEKINQIQAQQQGIDTQVNIYPEMLIEVNPNTNEIVWQWRSFDHIIQDRFPQTPNYGSVSENPQLIDFNYNLMDNGDIMHANGIDYDEEKDVIYLSVNFYHEIWVIDHSTTTAEAATDSGGNYNKGGNLLYRFGNPEAYGNTSGQRLFYNNHFPNLLENNEPGEGNLLVYMNGNDVNQSVIYELDIPDNFNLQANTNNEPGIVWSFTETDLYFGRISGAVRLQNGNTLITEGDYGFWEVTTDGQIVWKYNGSVDSNFWRSYGYLKNSSAVESLGL